MFSGGVATVFVADMDRAVRFYAETLGLKLEFRFGNEWASIKAGDGLTIGLHPASKESPAGEKGSITIGFQVSRPIQNVVQILKEKGVRFQGSIIEDKEVLIAHFLDPDDNELYLAEVKQK
jgi:predicted enzyme related to lactoylglutathione lyase